MSIEDQLNMMGDFVEGHINDYVAGLADMNDTVVKIVEFFVEIGVKMADERELRVRKELDFLGENKDTYEELEDKEDNCPYVDCPSCGVELDAIDWEYRRCSVCGVDIDKDLEGGEG